MSGKERRLNAADWFLILLGLLSLGGILIRFLGLGERDRGELQSFAVVVEWRGEDARTVACLEDGEVLYTAAGEVFGVVRMVEQIPAEAEILSGGQVYRAQSLSLVDAVVEIEVLGRVSEERLFSERGELLAAGQSVRLFSRRAELPVKIMFADIIPRV